MSVAVILGSAFAEGLEGLEPVDVDTAFGRAVVHRAERGWALFRHGLPHRYLPHQVPWRAHAAALAELGVEALLITSSVGVLTAGLPLFTPMLVGDLLMPDNRLPDGSPCTMFPEPVAGQGHLVLEEGLLSPALKAQLRALAAKARVPLAEAEPTFAFVPGPRTKTAAENRLLAALGAEVNSMSLGPELVLANELEIPCVGLVVGHKRSAPGVDNPDEDGIAESLDRARSATGALVRRFLAEGEGVAFGNHLYRF